MITLITKFRKENKSGRAQMSIGFITFLFLIFSISYIFASSCISGHDENGNYIAPNPWFRCLAYFTVIGSIVSVIYLVMFLINFYKPLKWFKNDLFLIFVVTYEMFIFGGYLLMFVQNIIASNSSEAKDLIKEQLTFQGFHNFLIHFVSPWLIFTFFILQNYVAHSTSKENIPYRKLFYGFLIPFVYSVYLIAIFFITHVTQYGTLTAFWNFSDIKNTSCIIDPNIGGSWVHFFYIPFAGFFIFILLNLFYFINSHKRK